MNNGNKIISVRGGLNCLFHDITSVSNLFCAWNEFKKGKRKRKDIQEFEFNLEDNIFKLHEELISKQYKHGEYTGFFVSDPKLRHIHKANVKDRILHQAIFRILYPIFDKHFIFDSYSSRTEKGTHKGVKRTFVFARKESENWKKRTFVLKCDIKKFFNSINHKILLDLVKKEISCPDTLWLVEIIINSFSTTNTIYVTAEMKKGIPLGNVISQLFANIYLNELDQFIKHKLKEKYYIRYCDDFIILNSDEEHLEKSLLLIGSSLKNKLKLELHPQKIEIRKLRQGIDFLGYVILPHYIVLRSKTKRRMLRKLNEKAILIAFSSTISKETFNQSLQSYLGMLKHCKGYKIKLKLNK